MGWVWKRRVLASHSWGAYERDEFREPSSVQLLSRVWLFATPWTAAHLASMFFSVSRSLLRLSPLSLWCYPTISPSVAPFSSHLQSFRASKSFQMSQFFIHIRWPKYSSFRSFSEPRGLHLPKHRKVLNSLTWDIWFSLINNSLWCSDYLCPLLQTPLYPDFFPASSECFLRATWDAASWASGSKNSHW